MKISKTVLVALLLAGGMCEGAAHPGSGIVVDRQGNVYFVDTGAGVWKIDREGKLTGPARPAYHWMALDEPGRLQNATLPYFSSGDATVTRAEGHPNLLLSSDFPISVGPDGALYYPRLSADKTMQLFRLGPSGATTVVTTIPANATGGPPRWLNGIMAGPDGSLYYTEDRAVRRMTPQGKITTVAENVTVPGCDTVPGVEAHLGAYLRGLAVDSQGTVYVAATGCGAVLKISADKAISIILRASGSWSPTGVAVSGGDVYVLEYLHTPGDNRREWIPRVRKLSSDGRVTTVATIHRK